MIFGLLEIQRFMLVANYAGKYHLTQEMIHGLKLNVKGMEFMEQDSKLKEALNDNWSFAELEFLQSIHNGKQTKNYWLLPRVRVEVPVLP